MRTALDAFMLATRYAERCAYVHEQTRHPLDWQAYIESLRLRSEAYAEVLVARLRETCARLDALEKENAA